MEALISHAGFPRDCIFQDEAVDIAPGVYP